MRFLFCSLLSLLLLRLPAQPKHDYIWLLPDSNGIDFRTSPPGPYSQHKQYGLKIIPPESGYFWTGTNSYHGRPEMFCLSDAAGNLALFSQSANIGGYPLFITSGYSDQSFLPFPGTAPPVGGSNKIVPVPDKPDEYYVIAPVLEISWAIINPRLETIPLPFQWDATAVFPQRVTSSTGVSALVPKADPEKGWWFYSVTDFAKPLFFDTALICFNVSSKGIHYHSYPRFAASAIPTQAPEAQVGSMCTSPSGDRIAMAEGQGLIRIADVDRCTGALFNPRGGMAIGGTRRLADCAFSPDGTKLYVSETSANEYPFPVTGKSYVYQYDLNDPDFLLHPVKLDSLESRTEGGKFDPNFYLMQLGPDGKIYIGHGFSGFSPEWDSLFMDSLARSLSVISHPDVAGAGCGYQRFGYQLAHPNYNGMVPHFPPFRAPTLWEPLALPLPPAPDVVVLCPTDSVRIGAPARAGMQYRWSPGQYLVDSTAAQPLIRAWTLPEEIGSITFTLVAQDTLIECPRRGFDTLTVTFPFPPKPPGGLAGADFVLECPGDEAHPGVSAVAGLAYDWQPDGWFTGANSAQPTFVSPAGTGLYDTLTYTLTVTDTTTRCNRARSDSARVIFNPPLAPVADVGPDVTVQCPGDSVRLGTPAQAGIAYAWSVLPASFLGLKVNYISDAQPFVKTPDTASLNAMYQLELTVTKPTNRCNRTHADTVWVRMVPPPVPEVNADTGVIVCGGQLVQLGGPAKPGLVYVWSPAVQPGASLDDAGSSAPSFWSVRDSSLFPMHFLLTATAPSQRCNRTTEVSVTVRLGQPRFADAGADAVLCEWASLGVEIGAPTLPQTVYRWEPDWAVDSPEIAMPRAKFPGWAGTEMELYLTAVQDTYCVAYDTVTVRVDDCISPWLPTAVSPNGDVRNDAFVILNLPPGCRLTVVDRWGGVVYEAAEYHNDWRPGEDVPEGVYLVRLLIPDRGEIHGWVTVVR